MSRPSLILFREPWLGESFLENISQNSSVRWRRSYRRQGGFWVGTMDIPADRRVGIEELERVWFNGGLMKRFKEATGSTVTWEGIVWEVELTRDGVKRSRSVADVWNASRVIGRDESGDPLDTGWYTNQASINRYLRRELILTVDRATSAQAIAEAQNVLIESAEAWPQRKQFGKDLEDGVRVTVVGDVFTANNRYVSISSPGTTDTVSDHIADILITDCDLLAPTSIAVNSVSIYTGYLMPIRAWDKLLELTEMGDGTRPYTITVGLGGRVAYAPASNIPKYLWRGKKRGFGYTGGDIDPWAARTGVLRDETTPPGAPLPGSFLLSRQDEWLAEVEMSIGQDFPTLKPENFDEDEIAARYQSELEWLRKFEAGELDDETR